jgi:hypothetical protein
MESRSSSSGHQQSHSNGGSNIMGPKSKKMWVTSALVVVVLVVLGLGAGAYSMMAANAGVKTGQYQAVFLTNGQVYFGKLASTGDRYAKLSDIYYLQVQQSVQPADSSKDQPKVSLAKLGSELHGPEDEMQINRDQILFWENLKDSSKVVTAIKDNQKQ